MKKIYFQKKIFFFLILYLNLISIGSYMVNLDQESQRILLDNLNYLRYLPISHYNHPPSSEPKVSIVIPVLNGEEYITPIVSSIQQQTMKDLEIIFVDDFSTDNTYKNLLKAQKLDSRIKIIKNKKNMGIMYSRLYGALESKGEYVTFLDCDDLYINKDLMAKAYETAEEKDLDIIQYEYFGSTFDGKDKYDYIVGYLSKQKYGEIVRKPEVKKILFGQKESQGGSGIVYDKLYSRNLIRKMGNFLGEDLIYKHLIFMEDFLISFAAYRCAENYMLMKEFGVWHWNKNPNGMTSKVSEIEDEEFVYPDYSNKKIGDYLFIWNKLFELTEDDPDEGTFRMNVLYILIVPNDLRKIFAFSYHYEILLNICRKFYNWKYVTMELKVQILQYCQSAVEISIPMKKKYSLFYE